MALNHKETALIRGTIPFLKEHGETISDIVYKDLLLRHPDLNNSLNLMHLKDGRLARALTVVILRFAGNINNISELIPKLERVCTKHCTIGVKPADYELVGRVIIDAFEAFMGPSMFTPETKAAWSKAYRVLSSMMMGREKIIYKQWEAGDKWTGWRKFKIQRKFAETGDLWSFHLVPTDKALQRLPSFMPGQYITIKVFVPSIGYFQTRQYSLSDTPRQDYYSITVKRDRGILFSSLGCPQYKYSSPGVISNMLIDQLEQGAEIECSHPSGDFFIDTSAPSSVPLVLISAGSGCVPLMSILRTMTDANKGRHVSWVHGCRNEIAFSNAITYIQRRCPNVTRTIFKTNVRPGDVRGVTYDYDARVDLADCPGVLHLDHGAAEYYICGPEPFMREVAAQLVGIGVGHDRIKCELFSVGDMAIETISCPMMKA